MKKGLGHVEKLSWSSDITIESLVKCRFSVLGPIYSRGIYVKLMAWDLNLRGRVEAVHCASSTRS